MPTASRQLDEPEAVAVFDDADKLYAAIDELQEHGFSRADLCMLADEEIVQSKIGDRFWTAERLEDDPDAPRKPYFSEESLGAAEGALISAPLYVAAVAAAGAVTTPAGGMAAAVAAAALAGGAGAAVGGLLAWLVGDRHAQHLKEQIRHGGLLLWVRLRDDAHKDKALEILRRNSGRDVHVHGWTTPD